MRSSAGSDKVLSEIPFLYETKTISLWPHFGGPRTLSIARKLLDGLKYLHSVPLLHRDLKDDNALVSASGNSVTILDLGQCKGDFLPVKDITFWQIGASRFCPPSKFEEPSSFNTSHDVFAIGVICYRMLTNNFPWEVSPGESAGQLKFLMLNSPAPLIRDFNSDVDERIISVVMRMIEIEDYRRISIDSALHEIDNLQEMFDRSSNVGIGIGKSVLFPRVIRDNLHGDIPITDFEHAIINTAEFQRLRYLKQLGAAHLVYPSAEHSRFSHALGVMHVAERIMRGIEMRDGRVFEPEQRRAARLYALVHDITHAPFGHTIEDELGFFQRHDQNQARLQRLLSRSGADLPQLLQSISYGRLVLDLLFGKTDETTSGWIKSLVEGPAGADVIDYIDRDAHGCGLDHRVDTAIFRWFSLEHVANLPQRVPEIIPRIFGNHGLRLDADHALISVLNERYALFLKVYTHPTKVAAGAMIGKALSLARRDYPDKFSEEICEQWTDNELIENIMIAGTTTARTLMSRYKRRQIFKPVFQTHILSTRSLNEEDYIERRDHLDALDLLDPDRRLSIEKQIAFEVQIPEEDIIVYASRKAPGATSVYQKLLRARGRINFRTKSHGDHRYIFKKHLRLWKLYVFCPPAISGDLKKSIAGLVSARWGIENEIEQDRRQLDLLMDT